MLEKLKKYKTLIFLVVLFLLGMKSQEAPYIEVSTDASLFEERYYYSLLTGEEQVIYQELYQGVVDHVEAINVHSSDPEQVNGILKYVMYDFPEIFWIDGSGTSTTYAKTLFTDAYTSMEPTYVYSNKESQSREKEIEEAVSGIVESVPADYDEYEKIKYVYDYLVDHVSYVEEAPDNQNIYSALVTGETVCAGYAKANQYVLNELGISCIYVVGTTTNEGETDNHAWNIVRCNDELYYVDVTWADPIAEDENAVSERMYDYLCCSEKELADTHTVDADFAYPECTSDDLNYYKLNDMYYDTVDRNVLLGKMKDSIDEKAENITFKFADETVYEGGKKLLIEELFNTAAQYLCEKYGLSQVEYSYEENPTVNRVTVYWQYE